MSTASRLMVLGAAGLLGRELVGRLARSPAWDVIPCDREEFDVTRPDKVREFIARYRPAWVINCAAMTHVDGCEAQENQARAVNGEAVAYLAEACDQTGSILLQMSTDYVFDGRSGRPYREDDEPNPINVYGRSKWLGEQHARACRHCLIVRTAWLYGPAAANFVETVLARAESDSPLRVVDDQVGSPTYTVDLAESIERLIRIDARGVFHVVNSGQATWYQLACKVVELVALPARIEPVSSAAYGSPAARPACSILDVGKYVATTGHSPREWTVALDAHIRARLRDA